MCELSLSSLNLSSATAFFAKSSTIMAFAANWLEDKPLATQAVIQNYGYHENRAIYPEWTPLQCEEPIESKSFLEGLALACHELASSSPDNHQITSFLKNLKPYMQKPFLGAGGPGDEGCELITLTLYGLFKSDWVSDASIRVYEFTPEREATFGTFFAPLDAARENWFKLNLYQRKAGSANLALLDETTGQDCLNRLIQNPSSEASKWKHELLGNQAIPKIKM